MKSLIELINSFDEFCIQPLFFTVWVLENFQLQKFSECSQIVLDSLARM